MNKAYKFHKDWNISSLPHPSEIRVSKDDVTAFFREEVEKMIPAEYRDRVEYGCRRRLPYHRPLTLPFVIWWLYPGKRLKLAKVVLGQVQDDKETEES